MFGYIRPNQDELKVRELAAYKGFYCDLCRSIKRRYGEAARLTLSYDSAFLALLLSGFYPCAGFYKSRCAYKPLQKPRMIARETEGIRFAADLNVLLSWYKLQDDWRDEKKLSAGAAMLLSRGILKKAEHNAPQLAGIVRQGLEKLHTLEIANCAEPDAPAAAFAEMMAKTMTCAPAPEGRQKQELYWLLWDLGRWLYLTDAWDDRDKDQKHKSYNPFLLQQTQPEQARFLLNYTLNQAIETCERLELASNSGILDNIVCDGCVKATKRIVGGMDEQPV